MMSRLQDFRIANLSVVTGDVEVCLDDELDAYGGDAARIERLKKATGLRARRVVSPGLTTVDLAEQAVRRMVDEQGLDLNTLDACLFVTQTPDFSQPANAAVLHGRLGLAKSVAAWDVNLGCSGWVYGVVQAGAWIRSGLARRVLLVAGDTTSRLLDPADRSTVPLFGDAASATVLEADPGRQWWTALHTDGSGAEAIRVPAGGMRRPAVEGEVVTDEEGKEHRADSLVMDGAQVFQFTLREIPKVVKELLESAGRSAADVPFFFFHQANAYILSNLRRRLKLEEGQLPMDSLARYGNLSSASVPSVICDSLAGSRAVDSPLPVVFCGFGVGLSWAAALTDLQGVDCLPVVAYEHV